MRGITEGSDFLFGYPQVKPIHAAISPVARTAYFLVCHATCACRHYQKVAWPGHEAMPLSAGVVRPRRLKSEIEPRERKKLKL